MGRKSPCRRPVRLRCRCIRDFSDSFRRGVLGSSHAGMRQVLADEIIITMCGR